MKRSRESPVHFRVAAFDYDGCPVFAFEGSIGSPDILAYGVEDVFSMFSMKSPPGRPAHIYTHAMLRRWLHYELEKPNPHMASSMYWLVLWQWTDEDPGFPKEQCQPRDGIVMGTYVELPQMDYTHGENHYEHTWDPLRSQTAMARVSALMPVVTDMLQGVLDA